MSNLDKLLDTMDGLMEEFNNPTSETMKLKANLNLVQMDLDMERAVNRNHELMLHLSEQRIHELDDKVEKLEAQLTEKVEQLALAEHKIHELEEKVRRQKLKRKMDQWLCESIEEYENLTRSYIENELENEVKRMREEYGSRLD